MHSHSHLKSHSHRPVAVLRAALYYLFLFVTVVPYAVLMLPLIVLPVSWRYWYAVGWPRLAVWGVRVICGVRYQVLGREHLPNAPVILLPKHQSAWETCFLIGAFLPRQMCFVYKRELHWVPFFGWGLAMLRMVSINRRDSTSAFEQVVAQGAQRLAQGRWVIIFPEGTRTKVGATTKYKSGGARLAVRTGVPVVPIALNSGECWPRNSFIKKPGLITVSIGTPISSHDKTAEQLNKEVQQWIEAEMRRISPHAYAHHAPAA